MENKKNTAIQDYVDKLERCMGRAVRPFRGDGYINLVNRYGTSKDDSEQYRFVPEPLVPDDHIEMFYENNGLFAKIIDAPAEEAVRHGFEFVGIEDTKVKDFCVAALDELDWEEVAMQGIKWARLFGGCIGVLLVNDGKGLEEPLDWNKIKSIDDIRLYPRTVVQPAYETMYHYEGRDPFNTRGSRWGMPEYYRVFSRYGTFTVHDSRCIIFQNGMLPENATNSLYRIWGVPEYIRLNTAIRDAEIAHKSGPKMLNKSVQPIYKMKGLAAELATEEGEDNLLRRLQAIDTARGMLNSIAIDSEGEEYRFETFSFSGVADVINSSCNYLSALSSIPQVILFGRSPAGMDASGNADLENYYNFCERIQKRMLKGNLRYLLAIICHAGKFTGEIEEIPNIRIEFNPLWNISETEKVTIDAQRAQIQQTKAMTAQTYVGMNVLDPTEVRKELAKDKEFSVEEVLDDLDDDELFAGMQNGGGMEQGENPGVAANQDINLQNGNAPETAPEATKLPQDMDIKKSSQKSDKEKSGKKDNLAEMVDEYKKKWKVNTDESDAVKGVGVIVIKNGKILTGKRLNDSSSGMLCGPGGHVEKNETPEMAAVRETEEEFGIHVKNLIPIGYGKKEKNGITPKIYICTQYTGKPKCDNEEMTDCKFMSMEEIKGLEPSRVFAPFLGSLDNLYNVLEKNYQKVLTKNGESDIIGVGKRADAKSEKQKAHAAKKKLAELGASEEEVVEVNGLKGVWRSASGNPIFIPLDGSDPIGVPKAMEGKIGEMTDEEKNQFVSNEVDARNKKKAENQERLAKEKEEKKKQENVSPYEAVGKVGSPSELGPNPYAYGFDGDNLTDHWEGNEEKNIHSHKEEAMKIGLNTKEDYNRFSVELAKKPVGGDIVGYMYKEGLKTKIVRYDRKLNWYVKFGEDGGLVTSFAPEGGYKYYTENKNDDKKREGKK